MRLLWIALENKRWDLAAHTIVLATARALNNGHKPRIRHRVSNNPSLSTAGGSGAGKVTKTEGRV